MVLQKAGKFSYNKTVENKQIRKHLEKNLIEGNDLLSKDTESGRKGIKKKLKLYPIPEEDSFLPIKEDSEEIIYKTKKKKS